MGKLSDQWIELFRAGRFKPGNSEREINFSLRDLAHIADSYDPAKNEAPIVIGHPELNAPAFGWIEKLRVQDGVLFGKPKQVEPQFEQMVEEGRFKKRSIALNKTAGGWELRHVGFLGAAPPVIKGLKDVVFNDSGERFEFALNEEEEVDGNEKGLIDQLRAYFAGLSASKPAETSAKTFSEDDLKKAVSDAVAPFQAQLTDMNSKLTAQATQFAEREQALKDERLGAAATAAVAKLKAAGSWVPAFDKMGVPQLFSELAKNTATIEFAEGDKKESRSMLDTAVSIFEGLGKIVPPGTLAQGARREGGAQFAENPGSRAQVDSNSTRLNELARERAREKKIQFSEALPEVAREHPELCGAAMTAGAV